MSGKRVRPCRSVQQLSKRPATRAKWNHARLRKPRTLFEIGPLAHAGVAALGPCVDRRIADLWDVLRPGRADRKSTRLNSSHVRISYAVFCLKKKTKNNT